MQHIAKRYGMIELNTRYLSALVYGIVLIAVCMWIGVAVDTTSKLSEFQLALEAFATTSFATSIVTVNCYLFGIISILNKTLDIVVDNNPAVPNDGFRTNAPAKN